MASGTLYTGTHWLQHGVVIIGGGQPTAAVLIPAKAVHFTLITQAHTVVHARSHRNNSRDHSGLVTDLFRRHEAWRDDAEIHRRCQLRWHCAITCITGAQLQGFGAKQQMSCKDSLFQIKHAVHTVPYLSTTVAAPHKHFTAVREQQSVRGTT